MLRTEIIIKAHLKLLFFPSDRPIDPTTLRSNPGKKRNSEK